MSFEAERSVLAMILIKPVRAWELLDGQLKPDDFKNDNNRYIYERMLKVRDSGADVDFVTLAEKIDATRMDGKILSYICELPTFEATCANIEHYAKIVKDDAAVYALEVANNRNQLNIYRYRAGEMTAQEVIDGAKNETSKIETSSVVKTSDKIEIVKELLEECDQIHRKGQPISGLRIGIGPIDYHTGAGFRKGHSVILAARPGIGKTSMLLNFCNNVSVDRRRPTAFLSYEMSARELLERMACQRAGVDTKKLHLGQLTADEQDLYRQALYEVEGSPIEIIDNPRLCGEDLRYAIKG
ncbi:MAG TPA: DnaB-like helicase C-terminal domain-containing protein, partial [Bdellovibrionota bacterium]|nr:DnaB-like helicase C-terminal domain-containing protein [Bdellovibrionota bacterium]